MLDRVNASSDNQRCGLKLDILNIFAKGMPQTNRKSINVLQVQVSDGRDFGEKVNQTVIGEEEGSGGIQHHACHPFQNFCW